MKIAELVPDDCNARTHDKKNLDSIVGSLKMFGQVEPLVVQKSSNRVIGGNGRLDAMKSLGWDDCDVWLVDIDGIKAKALALALNKTSELAAWDTNILSAQLQAMLDEKINIEDFGFSLDDIITPEVVGACDEDEVPEVTETRCKPGDLWQLGSHRLLCGDSTNVQHVERLMGGEKADMVFTDPPYGMNLDADYSSMHSKVGAGSTAKAKTGTQGSKWKNIEGDDEPFDPSLLLAFFESAREMFLWGGDYYCDRLPIGTFLIWDKNNGNEAADKMIGNAYEMAWSREKHKKTMARIFGRGTFGHDKIKVHPTQKPVQLAEWFFERWGKPNDLVADLFLGSGSTLIACEKTNRRCFGMEIDPHYCDVILSRWEKFTGKKAELNASGPTDEIQT